MLEPQIEGLLARIVNQVTALDPEARRKLRRLEGRSVALDLQGIGLGGLMTVEDGKILVSRLREGQQPEAIIRTTPGALLGLVGSGGRAAAGQMELSGDTDTARRFSEFLSELKPDWEEGMTRIFGDVAGVHLSRMLGDGLAFFRHTSERFAQDVSEYLRFESRQLVDDSEMEEFLDAVDDLRDDVAALERRIDRLEERRAC